MSAAAARTPTLRALRSRLSDRDLALLRSLQEHRYLTTSQLARLFFWRTEGEHAPVAIRACVRVLARLREFDLVERLERQVGGLHAGSAAYVWCLTRSGQRLVLLDTQTRYQRTRHLPSLDHLAHVLAIAEIHVLLEEAARAGQLELLDIELEPACWRKFVGPEGAPQVLKPDLSVVTATAEYEEHWLIEVDRGRAGLQVLLAKCAQYSAYARTGREQAARTVFPYVLWVVPSVERAERLEREAGATAGIDASLLRYATPTSLLALLIGTSPTQPATTNTSLARLLAGGAHERF